MPEHPSISTIVDEVVSQDRQFMQAAIEADNATLESIMSDDYIFISGMGQMMNKKEHLDSLKSGDIKYKSLNYDDVKVRTYGDTAVLTGHITGEGSNAGRSISGAHLITRVYVNQGGRWIIVSAQATRAAQ
jgi:ketosteroid isomerase-like protein